MKREFMTKESSWDDVPPLANGKPFANAVKAEVLESAAEYGRREVFYKRMGELTQAEDLRRAAWLKANPPN
jgi:hypothetical protein